MSEHTIRLRGGWEWHDAGGTTARRRATLPLDGVPATSGAVRLVRPFRAPPLDPERESLWLRLDAVPGLSSVTLNGRELARAPFGPAPAWLRLGPPLPARNLLGLDVQPPTRPDHTPSEASWGVVSLVIRRDV